jgi:hypothetical protein
MYDLDTRVAYWAQVTPEAVVSTPQGAKVFVPVGQTVDADHVDALMAVAASHKPTIAFEGTAWTAGVEHVAPGRRLRYALLVPRLIAPHRNAGIDKPIEPEEAVALLAQGRTTDVEHFAEKHLTVPSLADAAGHADWRWRFAAAFGSWVTGDGADGLATLATTAPSAACRTATRIVMACALIDAEEHDTAAALLGNEPDDAGPVDRAWVLTQLARALAETGNVSDAREYAAQAQRALLGDPDDVTASAIRAASAWLLFRTAAWGDRSLEDTIPQGDTAVSWWRGQMLLGGLGGTIDQVFRSWAEDDPITWTREPPHHGFYAAVVSSHLCGDQAEWCASSSMQARHTLALGAPDVAEAVDALNQLRVAGDDRSLATAAGRLWTVGPLDALAAAATRAGQAPWTHTSALANLRIWEKAGDVLDEQAADLAVTRCLEILIDPAAFVARVRPWFLVEDAVLRSLGGLVGAASDEAHRQVCEYVASLPTLNDVNTTARVRRLVQRLRRSAAHEAADAIRAAAERQTNRELSNALLAALVEVDQSACRTLVDRVAAGDIDALAALGDLRYLGAATAGLLLHQHAQALEIIMSEADSNVFGMYTTDAGAIFAALGVRFPEQADWGVLQQFLAHGRVVGEHKRRAFQILAANIARVPEPVREQLKVIATQRHASSPLPGSCGPLLGGAATELAVATRALADREEATLIAALLNGTPHERCDAVKLIGKGSGHASTMVAMLSDAHSEIRALAARTLARRFAESTADTDHLVGAAVSHAASADGALVPLSVAQGLAEAESLDGAARQIAESLRNHRSAIVRDTSLRALHPISPEPAAGF